MKILILVDIQNDFCPGGALAVKKGQEVVPVANRLLTSNIFDIVVLTQDWHPSSHKSFASNNAGVEVGQLGNLNGLPQVWWPNHCVWGTDGANFHKNLLTGRANLILRKGMNPEIDSYSGFSDNSKQPTGLDGWLFSVATNREEVYIMGLATDYCVLFTAIDAINLFDNVYLIQDGCRAVNLQPDDGAKAIDAMKSAGIKIVNSADLLKEHMKGNE